MPTAGEILRELHRLLRYVRDLRAEIEKGPRLIKQQQAKLEKQDKSVRDAHDKLKHLKVSQHEKETTLKATHQQIAKYEKQLDTAASKKEYDALQTEIAHAKEKCASLEDEILATMGEIDDRTSEIRRRKALTDVRPVRDGQQTPGPVRPVNQGSQETLAVLTEAEKSVPPNIRKAYDKQVAALAAGSQWCKDKTCMACYASVTSSNCANSKPACWACTTCGRLIYV